MHTNTSAFLSPVIMNAATLTRASVNIPTNNTKHAAPALYSPPRRCRTRAEHCMVVSVTTTHHSLIDGARTLAVQESCEVNIRQASVHLVPHAPASASLKKTGSAFSYLNIMHIVTETANQTIIVHTQLPPPAPGATTTVSCAEALVFSLQCGDVHSLNHIHQQLLMAWEHAMYAALVPEAERKQNAENDHARTNPVELPPLSLVSPMLPEQLASSQQRSVSMNSTATGKPGGGGSRVATPSPSGVNEATVCSEVSAIERAGASRPPSRSSSSYSAADDRAAGAAGRGEVSSYFLPVREAEVPTPTSITTPTTADLPGPTVPSASASIVELNIPGPDAAVSRPSSTDWALEQLRKRASANPTPATSRPTTPLSSVGSRSNTAQQQAPLPSSASSHHTSVMPSRSGSQVLQTPLGGSRRGSATYLQPSLDATANITSTHSEPATSRPTTPLSSVGSRSNTAQQQAPLPSSASSHHTSSATYLQPSLDATANITSTHSEPATSRPTTPLSGVGSHSNAAQQRASLPSSVHQTPLGGSR
eukprot:PhM_4_TR399/c1_g1_i1/m.49712